MRASARAPRVLRLHRECSMRILVTWGSRRGGTAGIGRTLAEALRASGHEVIAAPARQAPSPRDVDAVIVGGALYANGWHRDARRFVERHTGALRGVPVWLFSSGPLDDSAERGDVAPPRQVRALMSRIGALGHVTFGGRLEATAQGFVARSLARDHAGDWRNPDRIHAWAGELARALPTARPGTAVTPQGGSLARLVTYGVVGWALPAATLVASSASLATALHAIAAPLWFAMLALRYHRADGARPPLSTALAWTAIMALLDTLVRGFAVLDSVAGLWLPLALAFLAAWATGSITAMLPLQPRPPLTSSHAPS
jgi:menaquinone-dependent protoporphyrinogen oxidase